MAGRNLDGAVGAGESPRLNVRVTRAERARIAEDAARSGMTVTQWVRAAIAARLTARS